MPHKLLPKLLLICATDLFLPGCSTIKNPAPLPSASRIQAHITPPLDAFFNIEVGLYLGKLAVNRAKSDIQSADQERVAAFRDASHPTLVTQDKDLEADYLTDAADCLNFAALIHGTIEGTFANNDDQMTTFCTNDAWLSQSPGGEMPSRICDLFHEWRGRNVLQKASYP